MPDPFAQMLLDLLPNGPSWDKSPGSDLANTADEVGQIFYVIDFLLDRFVDQLSPETCFPDQLKKFQKELGIPSDSSNSGREKAVQAYLSTGTISLSNMIDEIKQASGKNPKIIEYIPSRSGQIRCGQKLQGISYINVYSISDIELSEKIREIIKRYKQAHVAAYFIKPDQTIERL